RARELGGRSADVAQRTVGSEVEALGERLEVRAGQAAHRRHELLEALGLPVELREHLGTGVLDLVLGRAGAQGLLEIVPEPEQAIVEHLEDPARGVRAAAHQKARTLGGVRVARAGPVSLAIEDAKRDQRVEEVGDGAGMKAEALAELLAGERSVPELVEEVKLGG